jgi:hypothetical protein
MKDFQVFNEYVSAAQTKRVLDNFIPYLKSGAPIPSCAFASLTLEDALSMLRGFDGVIRGAPRIVVEFGNTEEMLKHLDKTQIERLMQYTNTVRRNLEDFFGDRYVTATADQKQEIYPFFRDLINCSSKESWVNTEANKLVYRGKAMSVGELNKLGKWKRENTFWVCNGPYKSQYPMQSWSYDYHKALSFGDIRRDDLKSQIAKILRLGSMPYDKPQYGGDDPVERAKFVKSLKQKIQAAGVTVNDIVLPVMIQYQTNAKEFLFTPDASDKIKVAMKLFNKNTKERETVRVSTQPISVKYMIRVSAFDFEPEAVLNT